MPLREALIEAGAIRLRPILMTTFALIAGMIPVALGRGEGAQFRAPLGVAVIGGVITSTLLTLLVIPTFYEILDEIRHWLIGVPSGGARGRRVRRPRRGGRRCAEAVRRSPSRRRSRALRVCATDAVPPPPLPPTAVRRPD